jgi:hypothetical protein
MRLSCGLVVGDDKGWRMNDGRWEMGGDMGKR